MLFHLSIILCFKQTMIYPLFTGRFQIIKFQYK